MSLIPFNVDRHRKTLKDEQDKLITRVIGGAVSDWAEYKLCVGQIKGLSLAINELTEAIKRDDDDE